MHLRLQRLPKESPSPPSTATTAPATASGGDQPVADPRTVNRAMDIAAIREQATAYMRTLDAKKRAISPGENFWYPYGTLGNFSTLEVMLTGGHRRLLELIGDTPVADIGAADGDLAFFLETLGCSAHIIDHAPTNFNHLEGAKLLRRELDSSVQIHEINLDAQFCLPQEKYGVVFLLGILYHLKNPFYALEALAKAAKYCFISTRIAQCTSDKRTRFADVPVAYLVDDYETNNDPTNFWIFSDAGLRRILKRTGWEIRDYMTVGHTVDSDPADMEADERAFCLVESRVFAHGE